MDDDRKIIGGRAAATILGVNPYQTPVALWLELTGRAEPREVNPQMRRGMLLERAVLDYAADELGQRMLPGPVIRDPQTPYIGGHLDAVTEQTGDVVESKTARSRKGYGEPGTAEVPADVAAQTLHYLGLCPGAAVAWVPVLFTGLEFEMYRVERDDDLIGHMREICEKWYRDYVVADLPPPPVTGADASALFPRDRGTTVIADDAIAAAVERLRRLHETRQVLDLEQEEIEGRIKTAMGEAASLTINGDVACTWKLTRSLRFDQAQFKAAEKELYERYRRPVESRRFLLK